MKNRVFLTGIAAILLSLIAVSAPVARGLEVPPGWYQMDYAPKRAFIHYWNGTLLETEGGIQSWELYSELMMMMGGSMMGGGVEWVKMTIMWNPLTQNGQITKFEHHGENLAFTGWTGIIWFNPVYHFNVSGVGSGSYRENGTLYDLIITGSFAGDYYPDNDTSPFVSGNSSATELATLYYGNLAAVGGYDVAPNYLAVLLGFAGPWIIAVAASAVAIAVVVKKVRRRGSDTIA